MLYALDESEKKIQATPGTAALCPFCETEMVPKCGDIKIWHWAHKKVENCFSEKESETEWHLYWKSLFPPENVEIPITKGNKQHRADVQTAYQLVIEFQHSPIPYEEVKVRESFYDYMIWVFDCIEPWVLDRLKRTRIRGEEYFEWYNPKRSFSFCKKPAYLDCENILLKPYGEILKDYEGDIPIFIFKAKEIDQETLLKEWSLIPDNLFIACHYKVRKPRFVHFEVCKWHRNSDDPKCSECQQYNFPILLNTDGNWERTMNVIPDPNYFNLISLTD